MTKKELLKIAKELEIENYSSMNKEELEKAVAEAQAKATETVNETVQEETVVDEEETIDETVVENVAGTDEEETQVETETEEEVDTTQEVVETVNTGMVKFKKTIKGAFGFRGKTYNGIVELTEEEAEDNRIKHAISTGLLEKL